MRYITFIILLCISFNGFTQSGDVLRGKIISETNEGEVVNIVNLTKGIGTINDKVGFFQIKAKVGDTLVFSSVKYEQVIHIVNKKDLESSSLQIKLQIKVNELDEVRLSQYSLSGNSDEDVNRIKTYEDNLPMFNAKELDLTPFIHEKGSATVKNRIIVDEMDATPVNLIAVGRMIASLFKKKDGKKPKEDRAPAISEFYQTVFMVKELKIPETELYNFLDFLNEKPDTIEVLKSENELEILGYLMRESELFLLEYKNRN